MDTTTIEISIKNWRWLVTQKRRPGDSFNDVLDQLRERDKDTHVDENDINNHEPINKDDGDEVSEEIEPDTIPDDLDIPGSGDTYERRRQAIARLYAHLQRERTATRADFLTLIDPEEIDYATGASFWNNCVKSRDNLRVLEGVHPPEEGEHTWRYIEQSNEEDDTR